jgi:hypothetical protein
MSYHRGALGFTTDEEKEILLSARGDAARSSKVDESLRILREQERLKLITTIAAIGGSLYTLAKFGELISSMRDRRKHVHWGKD